jgi:hypothetical protein
MEHGITSSGLADGSTKFNVTPLFEFQLLEFGDLFFERGDTGRGSFTRARDSEEGVGG